jgi:DNA-binding transcriptional ArsR family regulator
MPNYSADELGQIFQALTDPTRRSIVERLVRGPATVSRLAEPLAMSLPAVMQHIQVLEACGLRAAEAWIGRQRIVWESRLDSLGAELTTDPGQNFNKENE